MTRKHLFLVFGNLINVRSDAGAFCEVIDNDLNLNLKANELYLVENWLEGNFEKKPTSLCFRPQRLGALANNCKCVRVVCVGTKTCNYVYVTHARYTVTRYLRLCAVRRAGASGRHDTMLLSSLMVVVETALMGWRSVLVAARWPSSWRRQRDRAPAKCRFLLQQSASGFFVHFHLNPTVRVTFIFSKNLMVVMVVMVAVVMVVIAVVTVMFL